MAITPGSLSQISVTDVTANLAATAPTGGTTPYSYQWYRSQTSGFSPGSANSIAGATGLVLNDTDLTPSTIYYYKMIQHDSSATPSVATTSQLSVLTLAAQNNLPITNVVNISVSTPQVGVGEYNTSNVALFSREAYASTFGTLGYKIYLSPNEVGTDFGTGSKTYAMALALFSQQPNILNNNGYLVVIPFLDDAQTSVQTVEFPAVPAGGSFVLDYNGVNSSSIAYSDNAAAVQAAIRTIPALASAVVTGSFSDGFVITLVGVSGPAVELVVESNTLVDDNNVSIVPTVEQTVPGSSGETLDQAIQRTQGLVEYFGIMSSEIPSEQVTLCAAAVIQAVNKMGLFPSFTVADIMPGGMLDLLRSGGFTKSRGLFYNDDLEAALVFAAAYAGRGFSTNFNGSNTTQTMHLKTLNGVQPDPGMTQTYLNLAVDAGADTYPSIQGVPKVFCSGENDFFDNVNNLGWFVGAIEVAGFNALAQTNTKIPQTENGMNVLKGAYRAVCEQAVNNLFLAPGSWTSPDTFGNQAQLLLNISQRGYYIYSSPVSQQLPSVRAARQAPLIQIAIKYAGAIHKSNVVVYVNP